MLLIFVTETTESNDSDKMYISKYLNTRFHLDDKTVVKWVYMKGKANYKKGVVLKTINDYIARYLKYPRHDDEVHVFYCIDIDTGEDNSRLNKDIFSYCKSKGYQVIWFNQTIEHVFLGKLVHQARDKKSEARTYYSKKVGVEEYTLSRYCLKEFSKVQLHTSNIGRVLKEILHNP